jgi:hypothetical protein
MLTKVLFRLSAVFLVLYLALSLIAGVFVAEGTLHPARLPLSFQAETMARAMAITNDSQLTDVATISSDRVTLAAWNIRPRHANGNAVILLHGLGDNRVGMNGYAELLLSRGFDVLMPDARAHGTSGGELATYGLLESDDIHRWFNWLQQNEHPTCIFGFAESMGAAELLQSLKSESRFCAVAAESPFSTFREVAYDRMGQRFHTGPWLGRTLLRPVVWIAFGYASWKYHLDFRQLSPEDAVARTRVPVFLIHGQADRNIPVRHSRRIAILNPAVVLWEVPNADHCGAISTAPQEFPRRLISWFETHTVPQNHLSAKASD